MLKGKQIIQLLEEKEISTEMFSDIAQGYPEDAFAGYDGEFTLKDFNEMFGVVTLADEHGGEDEGSDRWVVGFFPEHNVYIRVSGYYQSYDGTDWNDEYEVVSPKEKTVTVYE